MVDREQDWQKMKWEDVKMKTDTSPKLEIQVLKPMKVENNDIAAVEEVVAAIRVQMHWEMGYLVAGKHGQTEQVVSGSVNDAYMSLETVDVAEVHVQLVGSVVEAGMLIVNGAGVEAFQVVGIYSEVVYTGIVDSGTL